MDQLYVTANIVAHNNNNFTSTPQPPQPPQPPQLNVFDIPDVMAFPAPAAPAVSALNIAKVMNHNTMTDLMNQVARNAHKTPSVSTKMSDVSLKTPENLSPLHIPLQAIHETTK